MCIILYKPIEALMPTMETIKTCFENNPDGTGLLIFKGNNAIIDKGYMTFNNLKKAIKKHKLDNNSHFAIHFRIATSGKVNDKNCHPFPVSNSRKALQKLSGKTCQAIMHNGVIGAGENDLSDTQIFTRDTLYKLSPYLHDQQIRDHVEDLLINDRMLIFSDSKIYLLNDWIIDQGIYYSNDSFEYSNKFFKYSNKFFKWKNSYYTDDFVEDFMNEESVYCEYCNTEMYNSGNSDMLICGDCGNMVDVIYEKEGG